MPKYLIALLAALLLSSCCCPRARKSCPKRYCPPAARHCCPEPAGKYSQKHPVRRVGPNRHPVSLSEVQAYLPGTAPGWLSI